MTSQTAPAVAKASLLIRRPVADAFSAFTEPALLTKFWLARASDRLVAGARVEWEFMVPGAKDTVEVVELVANQRLVIRWSDATRAEWTFTAVDDSTTVVSVQHSGFAGTVEEATAMAIESTQGFAIVLCDLKTLLETGASANLVRDKARLIELGI
jgi:uncharacterized protein YndB with AHSA1/START domain